MLWPLRFSPEQTHHSNSWRRFFCESLQYFYFLKRILENTQPNQLSSNRSFHQRPGGSGKRARALLRKTNSNGSREQSQLRQKTAKLVALRLPRRKDPLRQRRIRQLLPGVRKQKRNHINRHRRRRQSQLSHRTRKPTGYGRPRRSARYEAETRSRHLLNRKVILLFILC